MANIVVMDASASHNLNVLLQAQREQNLKDGLLKLIISGDARTLALAEKNGVQPLPFDEDTGKTLADMLEQEVQPDLIVVLDWPQPLDSALLDRFPRKVIRMHPAPPGQFPGKDAVKRAFEAYHKGKIKWSGCNLHYIASGGQAGKVIRQIVVPVEPKDTLERFQERMRKSEEWVLLKGVKQFLYELRTRNPKGRRK